ncbi:FecR family protein [Pedobacter punctiformis]|uniref:DUF4974 domain-containing protein n=1 Tax=Pedobacter punctiformis TaxID=3004097 RepID=A0ABT4L8E2_9SPHI|nr:FecR family protein [Pedobacter sp. HCMS5-2]MCZ4244175.1 DUF4974 domain-containing protein [Pedobacter sp. HCMS5-2]
MNEPNKEELNHLADKWLRGELTPLEKEKLDKWYNLDTDGPVDWIGNNETEAELGQRLLNNINKAKRFSLLPKRNWKIAAAAILLMTLSLSLYFYLAEQNPGPEDTIANVIYPGRNKAVLVLANGEKINLTDALNGKIATQPGVSITKNVNGQLVYNIEGGNQAKNTVIQYNTIEAPAGGQWQVKLPDGSIVFLNALSSITYPTRFVGHERKVQLKGEAYFEIAHNKAMPFKVESFGQTVEVLGTHFNIMAYADEGVTKTTLIEGSVKLSDLKSKHSNVLKPGEQAVLNASGNLSVIQVNTDKVVAWKNGKFAFDNESIEVIMRNLARWYNVEVVYKGDIKDLPFTISISRYDNISKILDKISFTQALHFKVEGRRITVMP